MNRIGRIAMVLWIGAYGWSGVRAEAVAQDWKPSCSEVLRTDATGFAERYVVKTNMDNELGYDLGYQYWAECKNKQLDELLSKNANVRKKVLSLAQLFNNYADLDYKLTVLVQGEGSMYRHNLNRNVAVLEQGLYQLAGIYLAKTELKIGKIYQVKDIKNYQGKLASSISFIKKIEASEDIDPKKLKTLQNQYLAAYNKIVGWNNSKDARINAVIYGLLVDISQIGFLDDY